MAKAGAVEGPETPVDLTEELPLDDENVLAARAAVRLAPLPVAHHRCRRRARRRRRRPDPVADVGLVDARPGSSVTTVTVPVTTGTIQQTVASSGTIEPASQANLNFAVSGTVTAVNVKAGQTVTAGQVLATVDTTALSEDVTRPRRSCRRPRTGWPATRRRAPPTSTIDSDEASVTSAESSLSTAQTNLNDASLTSTIAGTVASVDLTVGQQVTGTGTAAGRTAGSGAAAPARAPTARHRQHRHRVGIVSGQIVVIGTDSYIVNTTVDDTQIGQIADGDQATSRPTGSPRRPTTAPSPPSA